MKCWALLGPPTRQLLSYPVETDIDKVSCREIPVVIGRVMKHDCSYVCLVYIFVIFGMERIYHVWIK